MYFYHAYIPVLEACLPHKNHMCANARSTLLRKKNRHHDDRGGDYKEVFYFLSLCVVSAATLLLKPR